MWEEIYQSGNDVKLPLLSFPSLLLWCLNVVSRKGQAVCQKCDQPVELNQNKTEIL